MCTAGLILKLCFSPFPTPLRRNHSYSASNNFTDFPLELVSLTNMKDIWIGESPDHPLYSLYVFQLHHIVNVEEELTLLYTYDAIHIQGIVRSQVSQARFGGWQIWRASSFVSLWLQSNFCWSRRNWNRLKKSNTFHGTNIRIDTNQMTSLSSEIGFMSNLQAIYFCK